MGHTHSQITWPQQGFSLGNLYSVARSSAIQTAWSDAAQVIYRNNSGVSLCKLSEIWALLSQSPHPQVLPPKCPYAPYPGCPRTESSTSDNYLDVPAVSTWVFATQKPYMVLVAFMEDLYSMISVYYTKPAVYTRIPTHRFFAYICK